MLLQLIPLLCWPLTLIMSQLGVRSEAALPMSLLMALFVLGWYYCFPCPAVAPLFEFSLCWKSSFFLFCFVFYLASSLRVCYYYFFLSFFSPFLLFFIFVWISSSRRFLLNKDKHSMVVYFFFLRNMIKPTAFQLLLCHAQQCCCSCHVHD